MESTRHGVSLSAAQSSPSIAEVFPKVPLSSSPGSSSLPIRAPPTVDSDFETSVSTNGQKSCSSSYSSDGFVSGEDDFDTASERPFVADPDDETLEETHYVEDYVAARLSLTDPDDEIVEGSGGIEGHVFRPLIAGTDETLDISTDEEEEEDEGVSLLESAVLNMGMSSPPIRVMPVAQLSGDIDEDVAGSEEVEDDGFSGAIKASSIKALGKIDIAPKLKVLAIDDGEENESEFNPAMDAEVVQDSILGNIASGVLSSSKAVIVEEDSIADELVEDGGSNDKDAAEVESYVASKDDILLENTTLDKSVKNLVEKTRALENYLDQEIELNGVDETKGTILTMLERNAVGETDDEKVFEIKVGEAFDRSEDMDIGCDFTVCVTEENVGLELLGMHAGGIYVAEESFPECVEAILGKTEVDVAEDDSSQVGAEVFGYNHNNENRSIDVSGSVVPNPGRDDEKSELIERQSVLEVQLHDPVAASRIDCADGSNGREKILDVTNITFSEVCPTQKIYFGDDHSPETTNGDAMEVGMHCKSSSKESLSLGSSLDPQVKTEEEANHDPEKLEEEEKEDGLFYNDDAKILSFGVSNMADQIMHGPEQRLASEFYPNVGSSQEASGQIVADSNEEPDTDEESEIKEIFDPDALAALLEAATNAESDGGSVTITSSDASRVFSVKRPANLSSSFNPVRPISQPNLANLFTPLELTKRGESEEDINDEEKRKLEKMQSMIVKFLRLVHRLGQSPESAIASQVLYRLVLAVGRPSSRAFSLESAKKTAMELEADSENYLNFSLNILVLGKTGVGKSATINSLFGEEKATIDAFAPATTAVKEIVGTIDGVKVRVLDTPGLRSSFTEQSFNRKVLSSIKKFMKKCPPDIVLYVDRLDTQTRDLNDLPLLRLITNSLGSLIWRNAVIALTHGGSTPPDESSGSSLSYELYVAQGSSIVRRLISEAVGDLYIMNPSLMIPVSLVENHPLCRKNEDGQKELPNGDSWRAQLLLLCYSMKILSEANSVVKAQDPFDQGKLSGFRVRSPPLLYFLSSLLQPHAHPKLSTDQAGFNNDLDIDSGYLSNSDEDDEDEYDQLPPFKPLERAQIAKLSKELKKAYFEEYDYRVKLLQKKQWREEVKRLKEMKKKGSNGRSDYDYSVEDGDQENGIPEAVAVPLPDMVLPPSFDGDNPAYRYRFLEPTSQLLTRPVLDMHGWDHDCGYDGVSIENTVAISGQFPAVIAVQMTKDKKEFNIHLDSSVAAMHGENGSSMAGFNIQTVGKQLAYIFKGETKIRNPKMNKTAAGISVTFLGKNVATGLKIEDQIAVGKLVVLQGSGGVLRSGGDVAYGANLEMRIREKNFPIGQDEAMLGLSLTRWRGDLIWGGSLQAQASVGRASKMVVHAGLNNRLSGQISVKTSSSEQLQIALLGVLPIANAILRNIFPWYSDKFSTN